MLVLGIDSAGEGCAACLWRDGVVLSCLEERMPRGQDARLLPMIVEALRGACVSFDVLDRVAVTKGPGSFTGLRVGIAAARSIGLTVDVPVLGVDRFAIYHDQHGAARRDLLVVLESKRSDLYTRFYPVDGPPQEPGLMTPEAVGQWLQAHPQGLIAGDAGGTLAALPSSCFASFRAPEVVTAAALGAKADRKDPDFLPKPFYLRPPDVTLRKEKSNASGQ